MPHYPTHLPDGETDFEVSLRPFSTDAVETFLQIERPASIGGDEIGFVERERSSKALVPGFTHEDGTDLHFYSIGEFYQSIDQAIRRLHDEMETRGEKLFCGDPARQVTPDFYYSGGGEIVAVVDVRLGCAPSTSSPKGRGPGRRDLQTRRAVAYYRS